MGALAGQRVVVLLACRWPERLCPQPGPASPQGPPTRPPWSQSLRTRLAGPRAPWREWASAVPTPPCMCAGAATPACPGPTTVRPSRYGRAPLLCSLPTAAPSWPPHPSARSLAYQARGRALRADGGQARERAGGGQLMGTCRTGGDLGAPLQSVPAPGSEARGSGLRGSPCCPWAQAWGHARDTQRGTGHQQAAQGPCRAARRLHAERGAAPSLLGGCHCGPVPASVTGHWGQAEPGLASLSPPSGPLNTEAGSGRRHVPAPECTGKPGGGPLWLVVLGHSHPQTFLSEPAFWIPAEKVQK